MRQHNEVDRYSGPEARQTNTYLRKIGGDCFMGFPTYRVVHSKHVLDFSGGEWCDWDEAIPVEERGKLVAGYFGCPVPDSAAMRRIIEVRQVAKYPEFEHHPGWIMERWMAPLYWGTPESWNSHVVEGTSVAKLGPYPHQGRYMHVKGPFSQMPTGPFLTQVIEEWEAMRDEVLAYAADTYVRKRVFEEHERDHERNERWHREASAANMECLAPFFSTSLEAGIARQRAAEHAGIDSHFGN